MKKSRSAEFSSRIFKRLSDLVCLEGTDKEPLTNQKNCPDTIYQSDFPYLNSDSRINFLKQTLTLILNRFNLDPDRPPRGFRLKELKDWLVKTEPESIISQMPGKCKTNCIFCYQKGSPPFARNKIKAPKEEAMTRLKYYDPARQLGLVGPTVTESDEALNNPHIVKILTEIRRRNKSSVIEMSTNGVSLTPSMINFLAKIKPLFLHLSLNSADYKIRKWLMKDPHPEVAIASPPLLKKHRITYIISIVAWPGLPFSDIEKTIRYAEQNDAYYARICLPGYSKFFSKRRLFDAKKHWTRLVKHFYPKLKQYSIPVILSPYQFVQNLLQKNSDIPIVVGTIKNSPAFRLGIKPGDLIKEINGESIDSIEKAKNAILRNLNKRIKLRLQRDTSSYDVEFEGVPKDCFPYTSKMLTQLAPYGMMLIRKPTTHEDIKDIGRYITIHNAKNVLVFASAGIRPYIKYVLKKHNVENNSDASIRIVTPKNHYFGGSIDSMDLLVVDDYLRAIKQIRRQFKPDLIVLPFSPFNRWGRDLAGRINLDIERETGIPVEFVYNSRREPLS